MHPIIRVTVSVRTRQPYEPATVQVTEERTVPIVTIDPEYGTTMEQWVVLEKVLVDYAQRAVAEAQAQAREQADQAPPEP